MTWRTTCGTTYGGSAETSTSSRISASHSTSSECGRGHPRNDRPPVPRPVTRSRAELQDGRALRAPHLHGRGAVQLVQRLRPTPPELLPVQREVLGGCARDIHRRRCGTLWAGGRDFIQAAGEGGAGHDVRAGVRSERKRARAERAGRGSLILHRGRRGRAVHHDARSTPWSPAGGTASRKMGSDLVFSENRSGRHFSDDLTRGVRRDP